jgi:hypothetical protein
MDAAAWTTILAALINGAFSIAVALIDKGHPQNGPTETDPGSARVGSPSIVIGLIYLSALLCVVAAMLFISSDSPYALDRQRNQILAMICVLFAPVFFFFARFFKR